jgi:hypothetical protein
MGEERVEGGRPKVKGGRLKVEGLTPDSVYDLTFLYTLYALPACPVGRYG